MFKHLIFSSILFLSAWTHAQQQSTIAFVKKSKDTIVVDDGFKTLYAFDSPEQLPADDPLILLLELRQNTVEIEAQVIASTIQKTQGSLPVQLFNSLKKGHLNFGKLLLSEIDSAATDSVVTIQVSVKDYPAVKGPLKLDFKTCCQGSKKFWYEAEYFLLLSKQSPLQDSIKKEKAAIKREKALQAASQQYLDILKEQAATGKQEIENNYAQFKMQFNSLEKINKNIDKGLERIRSGESLDEEQKKEIAFMTADANNIKAELKTTTKGVEALEVFDKVAKANTQYASSERQHQAIAAQLAASESTLAAYKKQSVAIERRIIALRKALGK